MSITYNKLFSLAIASLLMVLIISNAQADVKVYKWTDSTGNVHFDQTPPPNQKSQGYVVQDPPSSPDAVENNHPSLGTTLYDQRTKQSTAENAQKATETEQKQAACQKAEDKMAFLTEKTPRRLFITSPDGERSRMTDEQFDAQMQEAKKVAQENCN